MDIFIEPIGRLINEFTKLPGVGKKTAQRYAYKIINMLFGPSSIKLSMPFSCIFASSEVNRTGDVMCFARSDGISEKSLS